MPTFRFITDQAIEDNCADLLPLVEQYHRNVQQKSVPNGFTVLPRINAQGMAPFDLRARCMAVPCDYNVLIGDGVPFLMQGADTYYHGYGPEPADGFYFGGSNLVFDSAGTIISWQDTGLQMAHSRMYYRWQSEDTVDTSLALYRKSLQRLLDSPRYEMLYAGVIAIDDHFAYDPFRSIGDGSRAQVPSWWTMRDLRSLPVTEAGGSRTDGEWEGTVTQPILVSVNLDGGFQQGFYNTGYSADWRRINPGIKFLIGFGSFFGNEQNDQNLLTGCTTTDWCSSGLCNWWGRLPIGLFLAGRPLGDVLTNNTASPGERYLTAISGWCTDMITDAQLALTQATADIAALKTWQATAAPQLAALVSAGPGTGGGGGTPPPGIVVIAAHYRQVANPSVFVDVTVQVQALVNAGTPWSVHPGLADPYVGILKELWVQWTHGGPVQTQVFAQLQQVVLA